MAETKQHPEAPDRGHDFDGIRELDNRLPNWWLATLLLSMVFGYGYWMYYQVIRHDSMQQTQYLAEMAAADKAAEARLKARGPLTDQALLAMTADAKEIAKGAAIFKQSCAACHGVHGQGIIGPNLTDDYWLHGDRPTEILKTITGGVPAKGMPTWGPLLGQDGVEAAAVFVLTLKGKHEHGKAPQGVLASDAKPQHASR